MSWILRSGQGLLSQQPQDGCLAWSVGTSLPFWACPYGSTQWPTQGVGAGEMGEWGVAARLRVWFNGKRGSDATSDWRLSPGVHRPPSPHLYLQGRGKLLSSKAFSEKESSFLGVSCGP